MARNKEMLTDNAARADKVRIICFPKILSSMLKVQLELAARPINSPPAE
jgi:hypothetical protein